MPRAGTGKETQTVLASDFLTNSPDWAGFSIWFNYPIALDSLPWPGYLAPCRIRRSFPGLSTARPSPTWIRNPSAPSGRGCLFHRKPNHHLGTHLQAVHFWYEPRTIYIYTHPYYLYICMLSLSRWRCSLISFQEPLHIFFSVLYVSLTDLNPTTKHWMTKVPRLLLKSLCFDTQLSCTNNPSFHLKSVCYANIYILAIFQIRNGKLDQFQRVSSTYNSAGGEEIFLHKHVSNSEEIFFYHYHYFSKLCKSNCRAFLWAESLVTMHALIKQYTFFLQIPNYSQIYLQVIHIKFRLNYSSAI